MQSAPSAKRGFSPLDDELQLLPGQLTPALQESLVRLGTWMPFARAAKELGFFTHVSVTEATARRETEAAGEVGRGRRRRRSNGWSVNCRRRRTVRRCNC